MKADHAYERCDADRFTERLPPRVREIALRLDGDAQADPQMQQLLAAFPLERGGVLQHGPYLESLAGSRRLRAPAAISAPRSGAFAPLHGGRAQ
jgi:hypothetical protein